jgi:hypothetical protein
MGSYAYPRRMLRTLNLQTKVRGFTSLRFLSNTSNFMPEVRLLISYVIRLIPVVKTVLLSSWAQVALAEVKPKN